MRAREFKAARDRLGLSQAKLAKALGMSVPQMNRYEHGKSRVPQVVALALEALERRAAEGSKRQRPA
jgi:transcriptional regulator with XRE-family HTH domain